MIAIRRFIWIFLVGYFCLSSILSATESVTLGQCGLEHLDDLVSISSQIELFANYGATPESTRKSFLPSYVKPGLNECILFKKPNQEGG